MPTSDQLDICSFCPLKTDRLSILATLLLIVRNHFCLVYTLSTVARHVGDDGCNGTGKRYRADELVVRRRRVRPLLLPLGAESGPVHAGFVGE